MEKQGKCMKFDRWQVQLAHLPINWASSMDFQTLQPFSHTQFHPLFSREWCDWVMEIVVEIEKGKIEWDEIYKYTDSPSESLDNFLFTCLDMKVAHLNKENRERIARLFNSIIVGWRGNDAYNRKVNKIHTQKEINGLIGETQFNGGNPETAKLLGKITNSAYHLTNGLFSDIYMGNAFEYRGPYKSSKLKSSQILVIKNFMNLKPLSLWPNARGFPADKIQIFCIYENVDFWLEGITCHSQYRGDPIKGLKKWALKVDGEFVSDMGRIINLHEKLALLSQEQWIKLISLDFETLKQKGLELRCFFLNRLRRRLGLKEGPSEGMKRAAIGKPYADAKFWKEPKDKAKRQMHWKKLLDFRKDYFINNRNI
jgi:hypothetical protein